MGDEKERATSSSPSGFIEFQRYMDAQKKLIEEAMAPFNASTDILKNLTAKAQAESIIVQKLALQTGISKSMSDFLQAIRSRPEMDTSPQVEETTAFSVEMKSAASPFEKYDKVVKSVSDFTKLVEKITEQYVDLNLVWRGQSDASWGLHSALYRRLLAEKGLENFDSKARKKSFMLPSEDEMVLAERKFLNISRMFWRNDGTSALELMAILQHFGAPTRLIDVTKNPLIALYFALGDDPGSRDKEIDGRVFVLATQSPGAESGSEVDNSAIELSDQWSGRVPMWHLLQPHERSQANWGTGRIRRVWFPPDYVDRISAQNAGFLLDGVPIWTRETASSFRKTSSPSQTYWNRNEVIRSGSIYAKYYEVGKQITQSKRNWAPTFSIKIPAESKGAIREILDSTYGINFASLFPDKFALAKFLSETKFL